jgi:hypothetical protein
MTATPPRERLPNRCVSENGQVVAFPLSRRRALVRRLAELTRRQLSEEIVERQVRALEGTVRAEIWHVVMAPIWPSGNVKRAEIA